MKRPGFFDAKSGMRYVLVGQIERVALARSREERAGAVNVLASLASPWTREDPVFAAEAKGINGGLKPGAAIPDEARYAMLQAIICSLARKGMLDTPNLPMDDTGFLDREAGEAGEAEGGRVVS